MDYTSKYGTSTPLTALDTAGEFLSECNLYFVLVSNTLLSIPANAPPPCFHALPNPLSSPSSPSRSSPNPTPSRTRRHRPALTFACNIVLTEVKVTGGEHSKLVGAWATYSTSSGTRKGQRQSCVRTSDGVNVLGKTLSRTHNKALGHPETSKVGRRFSISPSDP